MTLFELIEFGWIDLFEIALVAFILYKLYLIFRGTAAVPILLALVGLFVAQQIVQTTELKVLTAVFDGLGEIYVLAAIILFQPEIRRVLVMLGRTQLFQRFATRSADDETVAATVNAVNALIDRKWGALIAFKRYNGLRSYAETGILLQANATQDLLVSIFNTGSQLHDGAVIIVNGRIEAARCILPVSRSKQMGPDLGLRHRAAVGLTEETDAYVVVVSEQSGRIAIAENGVIASGLTSEELRENLLEALRKRTPMTSAATAGA